MSAYLDQTGEPSDEPGRFVTFSHLDPLALVPGMAFRPIATEALLVNQATIEAGTELATHHHAEEQIAIVTAGELTFTVGSETRTLRAGDCAVIPPNVPHGGVAGPEGAVAIDVFTPPRAGIVAAMG